MSSFAVSECDKKIYGAMRFYLKYLCVKLLE